MLWRPDGGQREQCSFQEWNSTTCPHGETRGLRDSQEAFLFSPTLNTKIGLVAEVERRAEIQESNGSFCVCVSFLRLCVCIWCLVGAMYSIFTWWDNAPDKPCKLAKPIITHYHRFHYIIHVHCPVKCKVLNYFSEQNVLSARIQYGKFDSYASLCRPGVVLSKMYGFKTQDLICLFLQRFSGFWGNSAFVHTYKLKCF